MSNSLQAMRVARGMSQSFCIALLLLTCCALSAQNLSAQNQDHRVRNIVLVHGAWADGSGWKGVYDILVKDGYTSASSKSRKLRLKTTWLRPNVSLLNKMDRAFLSVIAMGEP